jgi:hypothetical protein
MATSNSPSALFPECVSTSGGQRHWGGHRAIGSIASHRCPRVSLYYVAATLDSRLVLGRTSAESIESASVLILSALSPLGDGGQS